MRLAEQNMVLRGQRTQAWSVNPPLPALKRKREVVCDYGMHDQSKTPPPPPAQKFPRKERGETVKK